MRLAHGCLSTQPRTKVASGRGPRNSNLKARPPGMETHANKRSLLAGASYFLMLVLSLPMCRHDRRLLFFAPSCHELKSQGQFVVSTLVLEPDGYYSYAYYVDNVSIICHMQKEASVLFKHEFTPQLLSHILIDQKHPRSTQFLNKKDM